MDDALRAGYYVHFRLTLLPVEATVRRVSERVRRGGHAVPEQKIRERYDRLWGLVARARDRVDRVEFFDNHLARGQTVSSPRMPTGR